MNGHTSARDLKPVSCTVADWLADVGRLLQCVQLVVENSLPSQGAPPEVNAVFPKLPPLIRQCRSQIPTDRMIEVWLRELAASHSPRPDEDLHPDQAWPSRGRRREPLPLCDKTH